MNTILVWVLVTASIQNHQPVVYSPPMATLEECQRVQTIVQSTDYGIKGRCIQMRIAK